MREFGLTEGPGAGDGAAMEGRYRAVVAALAEAVTLYDSQGRLVAANRMAARILGMDAQAFQGRSLNEGQWEAYREDGSTWPQPEYPAIRTLRTGEALWGQVMGIRGPDGSIRWISINTQPIFEKDSRRPSMVVASFADVTDRKMTEQRLRESETRYRLLVDDAPVGIGVHRGGRFVYVNAALARMIGASEPDEVVGREALDFVHPDFKGLVRGRIRDLNLGVPVEAAVRERLIGVDGREVDVEVTGSPITEGGEPAVQIVVRDITEQKRLEEQLIQSQKMEAVGRLASGVAHEFGNLLTAITGYTALAKRTLSPAHPAVQALDRVQEAAEQASGVTNSLLTFARKSGGEKAAIALAEPVERAARLLRRTLPAAVEFRVLAEGAGDVWVLGDVNQLQQAIVNLAINSRDAMRGMEKGRLEIFAGEEGGGAVIRVSDTGRGMSVETRARLFEPFFTTKPPGEGTGLGLPIVRSIAEDHGGRVAVESRVGEGTRISILLPRTERPAVAGPVAGLGGEPAAAGAARDVAVLAVAARHARELMAGTLLEAGFAVVQASDGPGLMRQRDAAGRQAGLLVIAADLPGKPGLECLAEWRRAGDRTPAIVVMSGPGGAEGLGEGSAVLVEPFQMSALAGLACRLTGRAVEAE